jgi:hypothetical protein
MNHSPNKYRHQLAALEPFIIDAQKSSCDLNVLCPAKMKNASGGGANGGAFYEWRRGRDSNPR